MDQHHLMLKFHWKAPYETIYVPNKKVCLEQNFLCGPIVWNKVILCFIHHFSQCFYIREIPTKASNDSCLDCRFNSLKHPVPGDTLGGV